MKKTSAFLVALAASLTLGLWADVGDLRITEVNPETTQVEVTNTGTSSWTTPTDLPFCHRLDCTSSIPSSAEFASGESKVFTISGLNPTDSDLWLYRDSDFENPASIVRGLKYGPEANVGRTSVAQAAGIWPSTTAYVPAPPSGDSLRVIAYDPTKPESWGSGTPSLGSFFGTGTQVANPLPGIRKGAAGRRLPAMQPGYIPFTAPLSGRIRGEISRRRRARRRWSEASAPTRGVRLQNWSPMSRNGWTMPQSTSDGFSLATKLLPQPRKGLIRGRT